ncbi:OLC1v1001186C1 [Oldenlandia corymbosa var. corymbosa]|uniref:OLC1v1001186C1 n=1 Tax=Oldenlandia corymbosa var. corymbosa TaxID=529605 RepID=A0AAV1D7I4_OLDCO|nr:OLC1v1001186C1 [Oldenlandia corymbosa var. corymbosa]
MDVLKISANGKVRKYVAFAIDFFKCNCSLRIQAMGIVIPKTVVIGELLKCQLKGLQQTVSTALTSGVSTIIINLSLVPPQDTENQHRGCRKKHNRRKKRHGQSFSHNEVDIAPRERMEWRQIPSPMSSRDPIGTAISGLVPKPLATTPIAHSHSEPVCLMEYTVVITTLTLEDKSSIKEEEGQSINTAGVGQNVLLKGNSTSIIYEADAHNWWQEKRKAEADVVEEIRLGKKRMLKHIWMPGRVYTDAFAWAGRGNTGDSKVAFSAAAFSSSYITPEKGGVTTGDSKGANSAATFSSPIDYSGNR